MADITATYESALPDDDRVVRKQMFGSPCAFVNRQMFFGTFEQSLVARVGPDRVAELVGQPGIQAFTPRPGQTWGDYVQLAPDVDAAQLAELAAEALTWAAALPRKAKRPVRR